MRPTIVQMPTYQALTRAAGALALISGVAAAQQPLRLPATRQLGPRLAVSHDTLGVVDCIRQLSDGRVLVNDTRARRVVLFDSALSHPIVIIDSAGLAQRTYPRGTGALIPYLGDTTMFVDPVALSLVVIEPSGKLGRAIAVPRPAEVGSLVHGFVGGAGFDARGNLVYRITGAYVSANGGVGRMTFGRGAAGVNASRHNLNLDGTPGTATVDSIPVIRANFSMRAADTVGYLTAPLYRPLVPTPGANGGPPSFTILVDPVEVYDDWAVVTDGSIAFVRAGDYHVDWINADGTTSSTSKMAHDWHRLTDSAKAALVDSVQKELDASKARNDSLAAAAHRPASLNESRTVNADELPDYIPPFTQGAVMADADNNLWVRQGVAARPPAGMAPTPPIYDIINRAGRVVDRIQLPPSLALAGFGPGVVYLTARAGQGPVIVKYRIR